MLLRRWPRLITGRIPLITQAPQLAHIHYLKDLVQREVLLIKIDLDLIGDLNLRGDDLAQTNVTGETVIGVAEVDMIVVAGVVTCRGIKVGETGEVEDEGGSAEMKGNLLGTMTAGLPRVTAMSVKKVPGEVHGDYSSLIRFRNLTSLLSLICFTLSHHEYIFIVQCNIVQ